MVMFCSIAGPDTLAQVRVLARAVRARHPGARFVVCLTGDVVDRDQDQSFETLAPEALGGAELFGGVGAVDGGLGPRILRYALAEGADVAVYLDPRIYVYAPLEPVLSLARERGIVLARRLSDLPDDGKRPNEADLLVAGQISPTFVAISKSQHSERFLSWWTRRADEATGPAPWLDLAPALFSGAAFLDDPGCNVSFWNVHERQLERRDDQLLAGGRPLRFFDFTGLEPDRPFWAGESATRIRPIDDPVLAEICGDYSERIRAAGWRPPAREVVAGDRLGNGLPVDGMIRALWADAAAAGDDFGDPASPLAADRFTAWLREPAELGGAAGVNRYLLGVYGSRPDLQQVFPDLDRGDGPSLIAWAWDFGRGELGLIPDLLPRDQDGITEDAALTVNVMGYLRDTLGLAEAARLYIKALAAAGVPVSTTAIAPDLPVDPAKGTTLTRFGHHPYTELRTRFEPSFNLVCLNGDQLNAFVRGGGRDALGERPTIGHWAWETDVLPPSWLPGFAHVDEIWVNSTYVAENLARLSPVPVVVIPQAIVVPETTDVDLDLAQDDRFTFLFLFDFFSTLQRKNPLGLIDAFTRAFAPDEGPRLLIKTINERFRPEAADELRRRIGGRPDIELVDRHLEPRQNAALIARADCYVSLHRSEGFGLTLAESMALGTPVIATGYSGNRDFTTPSNSYLVDWLPTRVGPGCDGYPAEGHWAEPDLDHAAELMRRVLVRPAEAQEKADRARRDIERSYAPAVAGGIARVRLEQLLAGRSGGGRRGAYGALPAIDRQLALDIRRGTPARGGVAGLARRVVLRLMLPFTLHERNLDRALLDGLRELRTDLNRERALGVRARARLRRLEDRLAKVDRS